MGQADVEPGSGAAHPALTNKQTDEANPLNCPFGHSTHVAELELVLN